MKRTYIKRGIWHVGGRKKQKGSFLVILGAFARLLLVSAASTVGGEVLKGLGKRIWGGEGGRDGRRKRRSRRRRRAKSLTMPRNKILLQRLPAPKRVQLPNGW